MSAWTNWEMAFIVAGIWGILWQAIAIRIALEKLATRAQVSKEE